MTRWLIAFLLGMLFAVGLYTGREYVTTVQFRLDRIEQYLSQQEIRQRMQQQGIPQSHKGELSQPQQWKV